MFDPVTKEELIELGNDIKENDLITAPPAL